MTGRLIETREDLAEGAAWLRHHEPRFAPALDAVGPLPLRRKPEGFAQLLSAIVSQQVSTASAAAIWARIEAAGLVSPEAIRQARDADLRGLGLSRPKLRYARALADAGIDSGGRGSMEEEAVIACLTEVPGIGRWTAEIYAMFSLGRADVFAAGDLALQEAARRLFALEARPSEAALRQMAGAWQPWRGVAARALWAYYRLTTNREGIRP